MMDTPAEGTDFAALAALRPVTPLRLDRTDEAFGRADGDAVGCRARTLRNALLAGVHLWPDGA